MRKLPVSALAVFVLLTTLFSSCIKPNVQKNLVLKEMVWNARHYLFIYNKLANVDQVKVTEGKLNYIYQVHYTGTRIDSVTLFMDGAIQSVNTNFKYNYKGLITQYEYFLRRPGNPQTPNVYNYTYDGRDRIQTIKVTFGSTLFLTDQLTYDNNNNVTKWSSNNSTVNAAYAYDGNLNPLYYVPNLFAIFVEEPIIWEYEFSQHNSVKKTYPNNVQVTYKNVYNSADQLINKSFSDPNHNGNNNMLFSYYGY